MNFINAIKKLTFLELVKWILIVVLLIGSITLNYICYSCVPLYMKTIGICVLWILLVYIIWNTKLGKLFIIFSKEAFIELQKVVWPTWYDTLNITLIVSVVTVILSVMLWGLDTILVRVISFGLRL